MRRVNCRGKVVILKKVSIPKFGSGISVTSYKPKYSIHRMKWKFNPYDPDFSPSVPHGHSIDPVRGYKLNPFTGDVYDPKGRTVGKADKKDIRRLSMDEKFQELIRTAKTYKKATEPPRRVVYASLRRKIELRFTITWRYNISKEKGDRFHP